MSDNEFGPEHVKLVKRVNAEDGSEKITMVLHPVNWEKIERTVNGKIRNILANEFGLKKWGTGNDSIRKMVHEEIKGIVAQEVAKALEQKIYQDEIRRQISSILRATMEKTVEKEMQSVLAPALASAARGLTMRILHEKPDNPHEDFGRF